MICTLVQGGGLPDERALPGVPPDPRRHHHLLRDHAHGDRLEGRHRGHHHQLVLTKGLFFLFRI